MKFKLGKNVVLSLYSHGVGMVCATMVSHRIPSYSTAWTAAAPFVFLAFGDRGPRRPALFGSADHLGPGLTGDGKEDGHAQFAALGTA